jgi:hypothetical protein
MMYSIEHRGLDDGIMNHILKYRVSAYVDFFSKLYSYIKSPLRQDVPPIRKRYGVTASTVPVIAGGKASQEYPACER